MSRQIQIRRGTATENNGFTGAIGEVTMDTTNKTLRVHDGATRGGNEIMSIQKFCSNITNCITEIPQNINLVLNNGTLTLKAGSIITAPNGTTKTTSADKTYTATGSDSYTGLLFVEKTSGTIQSPVAFSKIFSGTTLPLNPNAYDCFYNTTDSKMYLYYNSQWNEWAVALPIAVCTVISGVITSIDQIFNGFGYIGSVVYVCPGVKALVPNGRNSDGTLKNTTVTINTFQTITTNSSSGNRCIVIKSTGEIASVLGYIIRNTESELTQSDWIRQYCLDTNKILTWTGSTFTQEQLCFVNFYTTQSSSPYSITKFIPYTPFRALDHGDTEYIAHQSMPGKTYIDLTLGTDNSTVTAPSDGYFTINKTAGNAGERVGFTNNTSGLSILNYAAASGEFLSTIIPASKGDSIAVRYTATGSTLVFRFVYANGSK